METRVDTYRNLTANCISIRSREPANRGRVIDHQDAVAVHTVEFVVQPGGRQRVLNEQRKNVHAFVRGELMRLDELPRSRGVAVTYNPYQYESFVTVENDCPVQSAECALVTTTGVTAFEVTFKE